MNLTQLALILWAVLVVSFAHAEDRAALTTRLKDANASSALDVEGLTPWHLKLDVQLPATEGKTTEQGSIEEWWISTQDYQTAYTFPSYTAVEIHHFADHKRTKGAPPPPALLKTLLDQVVHPMPNIADIDGSQPDLRKISFGKVPLECIMLDQKIKNVAFPPMGLFPTYCFDPGQNYLRLSYDFGSLAILRNAFGTFQSRTVAMNIAIRENDVTQAIGKVAMLQGKSTLVPPEIDPDAVELLTGALELVPESTMSTFVVSKTAPIYPAEAKARHIDGTVVIQAMIGTDGRVHSMRLISVPDPDLAIAALAAVRQWRYRPYMVHGVPTDVNAEIKVNFIMR